MKVEKAMFEVSTSREEYYQLIAEKTYQIRKKLGERRRVRNEMEKNEMEKIMKMRGGMYTTLLFGWFYQPAIGRSYLSNILWANSYLYAVSNIHAYWLSFDKFAYCLVVLSLLPALCMVLVVAVLVGCRQVIFLCCKGIYLYVHVHTYK